MCFMDYYVNNMLYFIFFPVLFMNLFGVLVGVFFPLRGLASQRWQVWSHWLWSASGINIYANNSSIIPIYCVYAYEFINLLKSALCYAISFKLKMDLQAWRWFGFCLCSLHALNCQFVDREFQSRVNLKLVMLVMLILHDLKESFVKT